MYPAFNHLTIAALSVNFFAVIRFMFDHSLLQFFSVFLTVDH